MIKKNPENSPFELINVDDNIDTENVEVEVEYDENQNQHKYYNNKEFPKKYFREDFSVINKNRSNNNTIKLILILLFILIVICKIIMK